MIVKKKKTVKFTALCLGVLSLCLVVGSCDKLQRLRVDELAEACKNEPCNCFMDTLKGEWSWFKVQGGFAGTTANNEFKSIVKIIGQNGNSSINYKVFVEDTLFSNGSSPIQYPNWMWGEKAADIKLPYLNSSNTWGIFSFGKDTLYFWDCMMDGYFYFYERVK